MHGSVAKRMMDAYGTWPKTELIDDVVCDVAIMTSRTITTLRDIDALQ